MNILSPHWWQIGTFGSRENSGFGLCKSFQLAVAWELVERTKVPTVTVRLCARFKLLFALPVAEKMLVEYACRSIPSLLIKI